MTRFRELRKKANLTQEELIAQFNARYGKKYTAAAISQFEHDKRIPATESLKDFAEFFGVSIDYLLGRDTSAAPAAEPPSGLTARDERDIEHFDLATYIQNHDALRYDGSTYRLNDEDRKALDTVVRLALRNVPANE